MSENLSKAAEALGIPETLVQRSAEARAAASGVPVEEILAAWAEGAAAPAATPAADTDHAPAPEPEPPAPAPTAPETPTPEPTATPTATTPPPSPTVTPAPPPAQVDPREALDYPVVVSVPTAGLAERTSSSVPRWMAALFLLLPLFGLLYLASNAGAGTCDGVELAVDRISGTPVNCDGSEFAGRGAAGGGVDFVALGDRIYRGEEVGAVNCATCHGGNGQGGVGPALGGVLTTFGACADHEAWVQLGSGGWPESTYGDLGKPVNGGMPGFASSLSEEQLRAVVAFERVRFGGGTVEEVLTDCGLAEQPAPAEGEAPAEGTPPDGETPPSEDMSARLGVNQ